MWEASLRQNAGEQSLLRHRQRRPFFILEKKEMEVVSQKLREETYQQGGRD